MGPQRDDGEVCCCTSLPRRMWPDCVLEARLPTRRPPQASLWRSVSATTRRYPGSLSSRSTNVPRASWRPRHPQKPSRVYSSSCSRPSRIGIRSVFRHVGPASPAMLDRDFLCFCLRTCPLMSTRACPRAGRLWERRPLCGDHYVDAYLCSVLSAPYSYTRRWKIMTSRVILQDRRLLFPANPDLSHPAALAQLYKLSSHTE